MSEPVLRVATWNLEWASPSSGRGRLLLKELAAIEADILCITESYASMLPSYGHVISADADYGYTASPERRKVLLWSRRPWSDVDAQGSTDLPGGRFVAGTTATPLGAVRVFGVCIPWQDAHVRTGRRDRMPWQDHLSFLAALPPVVAQRHGFPSLWVGDFNQRLPNLRSPTHVRSALNSVLHGWHVATAGPITPLGELAIDHIVHSPEFEVETVIGRSRFAEDGTRLSDHFGIVAALRLIAQPALAGDEPASMVS